MYPNSNYSNYSNYSNFPNTTEKFVDFNSDIQSDKQEVMDMLQEKSRINTNLDDVLKNENTYMDKLNDKYLESQLDMGDKYEKILNRFSKGLNTNNVVIKKKGLDLFNLSWRVYRTISLILILISFFVLKIIYDRFVVQGASMYILKLYKIVSVLIIINLCIFLFYRTYFRYISTLKGSKGLRGKYGVKGIPGKNKTCDITKKKVATLYREKNRKPIKDIINTNPEVVIDLKKLSENNAKIQNKGWLNIDNTGGSGKILTPTHNNIGIPCTTDTNPECTSDNDNRNNNGENNATYIDNVSYNLSGSYYKELNKLLGGNKPIIGASVNINRTTKNIQGIIFYSDKNKKHNPTKYKIGIFGKKDGTNDGIGEGKAKNSIKQTFQCPANSAIYKTEGIYDMDGLKGLKFYCQDIKTGKSMKAFNADNKKVYGVGFGIDPTPENENYFYDKIECPIYEERGEKNSYKSYPSFISNIGGTYNTNTNTINNIKFENCSYYRP